MSFIPRNAAVRTPRLYIRRMRLDDAQDLHAILSDFEVMKWAPSGPTKSMADTVRWVQQKVLDRPDYCALFCIELLPAVTGVAEDRNTRRKVIGITGAIRGPELTYALAREYQGFGYATEAFKAFLKLFWTYNPFARANSDIDALPDSSEAVQGYEVLEAQVDPQNPPSVGVMQKCGFTLVETKLKDWENPNIGTRDRSYYEMRRLDPEIYYPSALIVVESAN